MEPTRGYSQGSIETPATSRAAEGGEPYGGWVGRNGLGARG